MVPYALTCTHKNECVPSCSWTFIIKNAALPYLPKVVLPHHFHRMVFWTHQQMVHILIVIWGFIVIMKRSVLVMLGPPFQICTIRLLGASAVTLNWSNITCISENEILTSETVTLSLDKSSKSFPTKVSYSFFGAFKTHIFKCNSAVFGNIHIVFLTSWIWEECDSTK